MRVAADTAHYISRVLRMKSGDALNVFNATDGEFKAVLADVRRHDVDINLIEQVPCHANPSLQIHLGLGLSRGERMDYAIQKSTELGVATITPLFTEHSEVKLNETRAQNRLQHWTRIAINACEQCGRTRPPVLHAPVDLSKWLTLNRGGLILDQQGSADIKAIAVNTAVNLLIGPEGGFSDTELRLAQRAEYTAIKLGPRILRTETAPVAAISVLQFLYGDLQG